MPSPPISIPPFSTVPAPGSGILSPWAQEISAYIAGRSLPYYATTVARDDPTTGLSGAHRRTGSCCIVGTAAGTGTALPRVYLWDGTAWQPIASWGSTGRIGFELTRTQSIAHNTYTDLTSWTESYDPDGFYPGSGTTATVPAGLGGVYLLTAHGLWATAAGVSGGTLVVNGAAFAGGESSPSAAWNAIAVAALAAGATLRAQVFHNSGAANNVTARMTMHRLSP
jgi:hypothetical protein